MRKTRPALFQGRHFQDHFIVLCVRWYLRYCLTLRESLKFRHSVMALLLALINVVPLFQHLIDGFHNRDLRGRAGWLMESVLA